jgi:hypothetical protein
MKYKNSNNIVRRKIFSEDKDRQRAALDRTRPNKPPEGDLEKIEIVTFSNKFPMFRRDSLPLKEPQ